MKELSLENIILLHEKIINRTGGSNGIRDKGLVESALKRASITYDGKDLYLEDIDKIAVTTYSLINNHGFIDGNKRIGIVVMLIMLKMNDFIISYELIELGLGIANGKIKEEYIINWIDNHKVN